MRLRVLNDFILIEPDGELIPVDDDQKVLDTFKRGLILLPEKNMVMKLSNQAKLR